MNRDSSSSQTCLGNLKIIDVEHSNIQMEPTSVNSPDNSTPSSCKHFACIRITYRKWVFFNYVLVPVLSMLLLMGDLASDIVLAVYYRKLDQDAPVYIRLSYFRQYPLTVIIIIYPQIIFFLKELSKMLNIWIFSKDLTAKAFFTEGHIFRPFLAPILPFTSYGRIIWKGIAAMNVDHIRAKQHIDAIKEIYSGYLDEYLLEQAIYQSGFQLCYQFSTILIAKSWTRQLAIAQCVSMATSLLSLSVRSIKVEEKNEGESVITEANITYEDTNRCTTRECFAAVIEFISQACAISGRIMALVLFELAFNSWIALVLVMHCFIVVIFLILTFTFQNVKRIYFDSVISSSFFYVFSYMRFFTHRAFSKGYIQEPESIFNDLGYKYYCFTSIENTLMVVLSYFLMHEKPDFHLPLGIAYFVTYNFGILLYVSCYFLRRKKTQ